jgi:hypothetical protein
LLRSIFDAREDPNNGVQVDVLMKSRRGYDVLNVDEGLLSGQNLHLIYGPLKAIPI